MTIGLLDKDYYAAVNDYNKAILHGIVKIASKMGISTIQSYQGSPDFRGHRHRPGGHGRVLYRHRQPGGRHWPEGDPAQTWMPRHNQAFDPLGLDTTIHAGQPWAMHKCRGSGKEDHMYNPQTIHLLQQAARDRGLRDVQGIHQALVDDAGNAVTLCGACMDIQFPETLGDSHWTRWKA